ncbi:MAG: iron-containing alcohol dehydrogenase [Oligoflexus sp.]|nr:iron-containing alcohol dehydrogenase [Pseudopedobacter sp.]
MKQNKFLVGNNVLDHLCTECSPIGSKAIIVTEKNIMPYIGLYARVLSLLNICGIEHITYQCDMQEAYFSDADNAIELAKNKGVNLVIALGCNWIMDVSKATAVGFYVNHPVKVFYDDDKVTPKEALPIFNILTNSVLENENSSISFFNSDLKSQTKKNLSSDHILPKVSFLDLDYVLT